MLREFDTSERWFITGATGSGKTYFAKYVMASSPSDMPFIFIDSKTDALPEVRKKHKLSEAISLLGRRFRSMPRLTRLIIDGIEPEKDAEQFNEMCRLMLKRGYVGLAVDEAYMTPDVPHYQRLYTAGRSRHVPILACSQRPIRLPRVCISEATRICSFRLTDLRDWKILQGCAPFDSSDLPNQAFKYYDIPTTELKIFKKGIDKYNLADMMLNK